MPVLFLTVLIDLIGFGIVIPILPFMAPTLGAGNFQIALVIAVYSIGAGLLGPFWGRLSDRIGRKPVLLICLAGGGLSYVLLAFAHTLTTLYIARGLAGIMGGNFAVASAMVADFSTPQNRAKSMGVIGSAFGLGMVAGPFLGGVLAGNDHNFMRPMLFAAGLSATAIVAGFVFLRESLTPALRTQHDAHREQHGNGGSILEMLRNTKNTLLAAQYFLNNSCHTAVTYLFPLWVGANLGWGARDVGMVFGAQGLAMAAMQAGLIGFMVRKVGELRLLMFASGIVTTGFVIAATASGPVAILAAFFCAITGGTVITPTLNTLIANRTPMHLRGRMLGTTSSSSAFGRMFGPLFVGVLLSLAGFPVAWLGGAAIAILIGTWAFTRLCSDAGFATPIAAMPTARPAPAAGAVADAR